MSGKPDGIRAAADQPMLLQNCTPHRLRILGRGDAVLVLAPLERGRSLEAAEREPFAFGPLCARNLVALTDVPSPPHLETLFGMIPTVAVLYGIVGSIVSGAFPGYWTAVGGVLVLAFALLIFLAVRGTDGAMQLLGQFTSMVVTVLIAVALPAAVAFEFGGRDLLFPGAGTADTLLLLGRALQVVFIATASLAPGLLYYLFDRQQLATLREQFEQHIFRFDPGVETLADVRARYGRQLEEAFGRDGAQNRLSRAKRWPILLATLVITIGWILTLLPVNPPNARPGIFRPEDLFWLFRPQREAMVFAFLGAYFFTLYTVLRRFVRRDLKPSAYASVTVRIFAVVILAWLLGELGWKEYAGAVAFMIGIVPETGVALIQEILRGGSRLLRGVIAPGNYAEPHPLTELEGIGLYDRARLEDEGVTNIESLAHHDLVDLMIQTRIPIPRIIDWVDQAILYLHVARMDAGEKGRSPWGERFQRVGVRNATDLLRMYDAASTTPPAFPIESFVGDEVPADVRAERVHQLHAFVSCLRDDEWIENLLHWRAPQVVSNKLIRAPAPLRSQVLPTEATPLPTEPVLTPA